MSNRISRNILAATVAISTFGFGATATALPIEYVFDIASASGSVDGTPFTAPTVFTCVGDTSNYTGGPYQTATQRVTDLTCSVDVDGVVTGTFSNLYLIFQTSSGITGISNNSTSLDRLNIGVQSTDIADPTAYANSGSGSFISQWNSTDVLTTGQVLSFSGSAPYSFTVRSPGSTLVETTDLAVGDANCANGGVQIDVGVDSNGSLTLESSEIFSTSYACNGADGAVGPPGPAGPAGADGSNSLVEFTPLTTGDTNCPAGGIQVDAGVDDDGDGALAAAEIDATDYVCNGVDGTDGADGSNSLVSFTDLAVGDTNCANGGVQVDTGVDDNNDGTLDAGEIDATDYVCNGADGSDGASALVTTTELGVGDTNCANGGLQVDTGIDDNDDGVLDAAEIDDTDYVCNGAPGAAGADGPAGADGSAGADGADGVDGSSALVDVTDLGTGGENCSNGGIAIATGVDADGSGTLEEGEIDATRYVCNGTAGANGANGADGGCSSAGGSDVPSGGFMAMFAMIGLFVVRRSRR